MFSWVDLQNNASFLSYAYIVLRLDGVSLEGRLLIGGKKKRFSSLLIRTPLPA